MSFMLVSHVIRRGPKDAHQAWTLAVLADLADQNRRVRISTRRLAEKLRCSRNSARRWLDELVKDGWLTHPEMSVYEFTGKVDQ